MELKLEQAVRYKNGTIVELKTQAYLTFAKADCLLNSIIKVANTPQELVKKKDLVEVSGHLIRVLNVLNDVVVDSHWNEYDIAKVTKILTPNSNDGYDKQWEAK